MATYHVGLQSDPKVADMLPLTIPTYLPSLVSSDGNDSYHLPQPHKTLAPELYSFVCTRLATPPSNTGVGCSDRFDYKRNDTRNVLEKAVLCVKLKRLDAAGGGNTATYHPDPLAAMIERIEISYGDQTPQTLYGDQLHWKLEQETSREEYVRQCCLRRNGIYAVTTAWNADAWVFMEIPLWFTENDSHNFHAYAFGRQMSITIYWREEKYFLKQAGVNAKPLPHDGTANYIAEKYIRFLTSIPSKATKDVYKKLITDEGENGWLELFTETRVVSDQALTTPDAGAATETEIKIDCNRYVKNIRYVIRDRNLLLGSNYTTNSRWTIYNCEKYKFMIDNDDFLPEVDDYWAKWMMNAPTYSNDSTWALPIYNVPFGSHHGQHSDVGIEFANANDPRLVITMPIGALPGVTLVADIYIEWENYLRMAIKDNKTAIERVVK